MVFLYSACPELQICGPGFDPRGRIPLRPAPSARSVWRESRVICPKGADMSTPEPSPGTISALSSSRGDVVTVCVRGLEKTPAAIRDALDPAQREQFESEYRAALACAADTLDLEPVLTLVQHTWWVRAVRCLNPEMLDGVASDISRVVAGDESVFADEGRIEAR